MKVAVISDTHDSKQNLKEAVEIANSQDCSYLFHLGDFVSPSTAGLIKGFKGIVIAVYGNCDGDRIGLKRVFNSIGGEINLPPYSLELDGKKILLMHQPYGLEEMIARQDARFIFYGHLHKVDKRKEGQTYILNPGESGECRNGRPCFYIVDIENYEFQHIELG